MDTLTSLRVFREVVDGGSFVAAAARLNLSTAMASKHVAHLERQIGASLVLDEATGNLVFRFDPSIHQATGRGAIAEIPYLWESLEHIKCPTLVIRAEKSKVLSREIAEQMVERLPKGRFIEIPDAGHQVPLHQPDAFSAVVREFLAE